MLFCEFCEIFKNTHSLVPNNTGGPTNNLNINKRRVQIRLGGGGGLWSGKCFRSKVATCYLIISPITNYGCPTELLIVGKHQYNFSCSLYLYMKYIRKDGGLGDASDKKIRKLITGGDVICGRGGVLFGTVEYVVEHL